MNILLTTFKGIAHATVGKGTQFCSELTCGMVEAYNTHFHTFFPMPSIQKLLSKLQQR
jgi:hypothetical protein